MSIFARLRDNVKYPQLLPGPDIITANVSWNVFLLFGVIASSVGVSHNDDAVDHDGRRAVSNESVFWIDPVDRIDLESKALLKIDDTTVSKFSYWLARDGIKKNHVVPWGDDDYSAFSVNFRICQSTAGESPWRFLPSGVILHSPHPECFSRTGVDGNGGAPLPGNCVNHTPHFKRCSTKIEFWNGTVIGGIPTPGDFKFLYVIFVDLIQCRVAGASCISTPVRPVAVRSTMLS